MENYVDVEHFLRNIAADTPENNQMIEDFLNELASTGSNEEAIA